ncbi:MAG: hypothetical protein ACR2I1_09515, partial [Propionibacteriaceae bacterium]
HQEVELSWQILDPVLDFWAEQDASVRSRRGTAAVDGGPQEYEPGGWGPTSADEVLARDGFSWRRP